ncbi:MAG: hypothetical protein ABL994_20000 [Verrucomicrobiales bacterium]
MKPQLIAALWILCCATHAISEELNEESKYLGLLSSLQFVESPDDLKKLIPDSPPPTADAGEDDEFVAREFEVHAAQVVLARAAHDDGLCVHDPGRSS